MHLYHQHLQPSLWAYPGPNIAPQPFNPYQETASWPPAIAAAAAAAAAASMTATGKKSSSGSSGRTSDSKPRLSKNQVEQLEASFQICIKPPATVKKALADEMMIDVVRVNTWFQNRRAKAKMIKKAQLLKAQLLITDGTRATPPQVLEYFGDSRHCDSLRPSSAPLPVRHEVDSPTMDDALISFTPPSAAPPPEQTVSDVSEQAVEEGKPECSEPGTQTPSLPYALTQSLSRRPSLTGLKLGLDSLSSGSSPRLQVHSPSSYTMSQPSRSCSNSNISGDGISSNSSDSNELAEEQQLSSYLSELACLPPHSSSGLDGGAGRVSMVDMSASGVYPTAIDLACDVDVLSTFSMLMPELLPELSAAPLEDLESGGGDGMGSLGATSGPSECRQPLPLPLTDLSPPPPSPTPFLEMPFRVASGRSIASRRNVPKPAPLGLPALHGQSCDLIAARLVDSPRAYDPASNMRRVASAGFARIQKSTCTSPLPFLKSEKLLRMAGSPHNVASMMTPPTPFTPLMPQSGPTFEVTASNGGLDEDKFLAYHLSVQGAHGVGSPFLIDPTPNTPPPTPGLPSNLSGAMLGLDSVYEYSIPDEPLLTPGLGGFEAEFPSWLNSMSFHNHQPHSLPSYLAASQPSTPSFPPSGMGQMSSLFHGLPEATADFVWPDPYLESSVHRAVKLGQLAPVPVAEGLSRANTDYVWPDSPMHPFKPSTPGPSQLARTPIQYHFTNFTVDDFR